MGGSNLVTKLQLMRLLSALMAAITALLTFYFLREILPGTPWAATVGALCVALQPLFISMSAIVSPEAMLYTASTAVFLCMALAFRRGFSTRLALAMGVVIAVGFTSKVNYVGVALGVYTGLAVLAVRGFKSHRWAGLRSPAIAGAHRHRSLRAVRAAQRADEQSGHRWRGENGRASCGRGRCSKSSATPGNCSYPGCRG